LAKGTKKRGARRLPGSLELNGCGVSGIAMLGGVVESRELHQKIDQCTARFDRDRGEAYGAHELSLCPDLVNDLADKVDLTRIW